MTHEQSFSSEDTNPIEPAADYASYLEASHIVRGEGGKNVSVALPNRCLDIIMALASIDTENQRGTVTLGTEIRAAILYYGDMRRSRPGFNEQIERAKAQLERLLPPDPSADNPSTKGEV